MDIPARVKKTRQNRSLGGCQRGTVTIGQVIADAGREQHRKPADDIRPRVLGYAAEEIADLLTVSIDTVRVHIKGIYGKLHVHSRGEAVAKYLRK